MIPTLLIALLSLQPAARGERILIVAPHIDDEALAAGGYAMDAAAAGAEVYVVYMTAGDHSRTALAANRLTFFATARMNRKGNRRIAEGNRAARFAGIDEPFNLGYPDRGLRRMLLRPDRVIRSASTGKRAVPYASAVSPGAPYTLESLLSDLDRVIEMVRPDLVIAPLAEDHHADHRATAKIVDVALEETGWHGQRFGYIVHSWGVKPASGWVVYPLSSNTAEKKRELLMLYRSQRRSPYLMMLFSAFSGQAELFRRVTH